MPRDLSGYVCIVTGASRGIGKAISIALGDAGATVYITGRTLDSSNPQEMNKECLKETARIIEKRGGKAIAVAVDHTDDNQVAGLFTRVRREQGGRLDVLVNSAFSATDYLLTEAGPGSVYWEPSNTVRSPSEEWDIVNRVGLRNAYTCCVLATRMMVECRAKSEQKVNHSSNTASPVGNGAIQTSASIKPPPGLIVNISSIGGTWRFFNVAFCAGKSALDRMSLEMARDLNSRGVDVAVISLLPGLVRTETVLAALESGDAPAYIVKATGLGLDLPLEIPAKVIATLVGQPSRTLAKYSGRCVFGADLAKQLGLRNSKGAFPTSPRSVKAILQLAGWNRLAFFVPSFVTFPHWVLAVIASKF